MQMQRLREIDEARDRAAFERALVSFGHQIGFELASAAMAVERDGQPSEFSMVGNTPAGWQPSAHDPDYVRRDPVLKLMRARRVPFIYDQDLYVESGAGDMWEAMAPYGYRTGIAVATHLPGGKHFLLGVDRTRRLPSAENRLARLMADLHLFAVYAQTAAERCLLAPTSSTPTSNAVAVSRTRRPFRDQAALLDESAGGTGAEKMMLELVDVEILQWAAEGKSTWAIGQLMSLSESVVRRRIDRVRSTLGVATRQQAVARAVGLGLVKL
jgi:DNA-binding CsgD family transcriptional regulator